MDQRIDHRIYPEISMLNFKILKYQNNYLGWYRFSNVEDITFAMTFEAV